MFNRPIKKKKADAGVPVIAIDNAAFLAHLKEVHTQEILPEAVERAKDDASRDQPHVDQRDTVHLDFLCTRYDRLVLDYKSRSNINEQRYNANKDIAQFVRLKKRLADKLQEVQNQLRLKKRAVEQLTPYRQRILADRRSLFGIALLSGSEAIFASSSFQVFVQNLLFSLIIGLTFAVALYYSAILGAKLLRMARGRWQSVGILTGILAVIGAVFTVLGHFRIVYLEQMSGDGDIGNHLSAPAFAGVQLFLFSCAILLKYFFMATKEEREAHRKWKDAKIAIARLEGEQKDLEGIRANLEEGLDRTLITRRSLISKAADIELKIASLYREACSRYVQANLHHRDTGGKVPVCFRDPDGLPKLTLFFQDPELLEFNETLLQGDV